MYTVKRFNGLLDISKEKPSSFIYDKTKVCKVITQIALSLGTQHNDNIIVEQIPILGLGVFSISRLYLIGR